METKRDGLVGGVGPPGQKPDTSEVRVDPQIRGVGVIARRLSRPEEPPSGGDRCRLDIIAIVAPYQHVDAVGADVTHGRRQVGCDLALHIDIPLLDVVSPRIRFHVRAVERIYADLAEGTLWIGGQNADSGERFSRRTGNNAVEEKRRLYAFLGVEISRQQQYVEDRVATTNGRLSIATRIPGKAESRLKIKSGGVRV